MNDFLICANAVMPIVLTMAYGYLAKTFHFITRDMASEINRLLFKLFMPAMVFYNIYTSDISNTVNAKLICYAVCTTFVSFFGAVFFVYHIQKDNRKRGVLIQGIFRSNYVAIGIPIARMLTDANGIGTVSMLIAVIVPTFNILSIMILAVCGGQKITIKRLALEIMRNPLIIGSVLGLLTQVASVDLPQNILNVINSISGVASPLLLFTLGAFFQFTGMRKYRNEIVIVCVLRLVIIPSVFLTIAAYLGFRGTNFISLIGLYCSATAVGSFAMAQQMGGDGELAGNLVVITSLLCPITIFFWTFLFKSLGIF